MIFSQSCLNIVLKYTIIMIAWTLPCWPRFCSFFVDVFSRLSWTYHLLFRSLYRILFWFFASLNWNFYRTFRFSFLTYCIFQYIHFYFQFLLKVRPESPDVAAVAEFVSFALAWNPKTRSFRLKSIFQDICWILWLNCVWHIVWVENRRRFQYRCIGSWRFRLFKVEWKGLKVSLACGCILQQYWGFHKNLHLWIRCFGIWIRLWILLNTMRWSRSLCRLVFWCWCCFRVLLVLRRSFRFFCVLFQTIYRVWWRYWLLRNIEVHCGIVRISWIFIDQTFFFRLIPFFTLLLCWCWVSASQNFLSLFRERGRGYNRDDWCEWLHRGRQSLKIFFW